ncbi:ribbon-helix-helix domain-containing protein [Rubrimonas cliftonensis]|uniref:ribbon-helix-helix domain-containing protein n=1 Tax=Rubrimonas cliftonensis TaxID=89524 RepID=UPI0031831268
MRPPRPRGRRLSERAGAGPTKRSLTLSGHRTSVTLEPAFWEALAEMARADGASLNATASRIDARRPPDQGLASALRVAALEWALRRRGDQPIAPRAGKASSSQ